MRTGHIYFLRAAEYVKIGFSTKPSKRLKDLALSIPMESTVAGIHAGTNLQEQRLHRAFARFRVRGEWYWWVPEIEHVAANGLRDIGISPVAGLSPEAEQVSEAMLRAVEIAGSQTDLSVLAGINTVAIIAAIKKGKLTAENARKIHVAINGAVHFSVLQPNHSFVSRESIVVMARAAATARVQQNLEPGAQVT